VKVKEVVAPNTALSMRDNGPGRKKGFRDKYRTERGPQKALELKI